MRKLMTLLGAAAMLLALSGSANAGYWEVTYDLGTSTVTTNSPAGALTDPLTGKWRFQFDSASAAAPAPYTGARMIAGTQHIAEVHFDDKAENPSCRIELKEDDS